MTIALFMATAALIAYTYVGYPLFMFLWSRFHPGPWHRSEIYPTISVIMAVHNGAAALPEKIAHLFTLDYPENRLELIVVSDGSTDGTNKILVAVTDPRFVPIICTEHRGKASAVNEGIRRAGGDILVFVDIRPRLEQNSLRELVSNFADLRVGCAAGELCLSTDDHDGGTRAVGGLYWRYEQWMRKCETLIDSPVGVYGGFYAVRRECATLLPEGLILDDMYQPLSVTRQGWRSVLDERARVWDVWPRTSTHEFRRKVRTLAGNYQLVQLAPWLLSHENRLWFQLVSHKLLRLMTPFLLLFLLALNGVLYSSPPYSALLLGQVLFYQLSVLGLIWDIPVLRRVSGPASAFVLLNAAAAVALFKFTFRRGSLLSLWVPEKAEGLDKTGDLAVTRDAVQS
jgi:cellulose synthase/poly-beta-1,6-N-acetylglucosamine synthase-like glycosyltransferase